MLSLSACSKKQAPESRQLSDPVSFTAGVEESLETENPPRIMEGRTTGPMLPVYFDFDSSDIRGDQVERVRGNAEYLTKNNGLMLRIEGNCDPRGTNEYNIALGERRAQSARLALREAGVADARITTISWGEEKLLLFGHDELSWAQNRRDDFVVIE